MTLHITKVAYGATCLKDLTDRVAVRAAVEGRMFMTTRYIPKRHMEITGKGSLFWIIKHQLVARAPILGFRETGDGKWDILLEPCVIAVHPKSRRAHQGWRYLEAADAPADLIGSDVTGDILPAELASNLAELSLI
jgi:hypothetical protein